MITEQINQLKEKGIFMKIKVLLALCLISFFSLTSIALAEEKMQTQTKPAPTMTEITGRDFKTFSVSDTVKLYRVSFSNQYGMEIVGNLFMPKDLQGKASAIVIGHPMARLRNRLPMFMQISLPAAVL